MDVAGAVAPARSARAHRRRPARPGARRAALDCAVGVGRSKMLAKLASRAAKPRASRAGLEPGPGVYVVEPDRELEFLHAHDVEALWGVGPATAKRLHDLGVRTVGDLAALPDDALVRRLGKASGAHLAALARGDDPDPVNPNRPNKSFGHEETFSQDLVDPLELERHVLRMAESVATMLRGALDRVPHRHGQGQVQGPLVDDALAHARAVRSPRAGLSGRWLRRCWPASTRARASGCWVSARRDSRRRGRSALLRPR